MNKTGRHQRKLSNVKLTEKYRFKYLGHWILISFLFLSLLDIAVYLLYEQMWQGFVAQGADVALEEAFRHSQVWTTIVGISSLFVAAILLLAAFTAHRIGGPYLAMKRTMSSIQEGNVSGRLRFREYDKLDDVEKAFNDMMDALQARIVRLEESRGGSEVIDSPVEAIERGLVDAHSS